MNGSDYAGGVLVCHAVQLEWLAIPWITIEAAGTFASRVAAGGVGLLVFGLASFIELLSAGVLVWRLSVQLRRALRVSERAEWSASPIGGVLLLALAAYVITADARSLWTPHGAKFSITVIVIAAVAIPITYALARRALPLDQRLRSRALRAELAIVGECLNLWKSSVLTTRFGRAVWLCLVGVPS
jgi:divalent metal cation (Fe/Co/Zn/Cd) transporter